MTNKLELLLNIHNNKEFRYSEEISQAVAHEILNIYDSYIDLIFSIVIKRFLSSKRKEERSYGIAIIRFSDVR